MSAKDQIKDYVTPSPAEMAARKKRNYAIAGSLLAFCLFIFILMIVRLGN